MESGRIPNRLKKYRRLAGFSQKEAAEMIGLNNASCLSRWEKGLSIPTLPHIFKLSLLYRTHPIHLYQEFWQILKEDIAKKESTLAAHPEHITNQNYYL